MSSSDVECCLACLSRADDEYCEGNSHKVSHPPEALDNVIALPGQGQSTVLDKLPKEIWTIILECLEQRDKLQCRLVSKEWKTFVDESASFRVNYNAVPDNLRDHVSNLRVKDLVISGLFSRPLSFKHPLLVKQITLGPSLSPDSTKELLTLCKNVEYLRHYTTERSDTAFSNSSSVKHTEYLSKLKFLKSIEIGLLYFGRRESSISPSVQSLFSLTFPTLEEIHLHFELTKSEWNMLFAFIERHKNMSFCKLVLHRQCFCEYNDDSDPKTGSEILEKIQVLKQCKLKYIEMIRGAYKCSCSGDILWSVLREQSRVERLCTDLVPSTKAIEEFVGRNKTLRSLSLQDISVGVDYRFDFAIFQNCNQLESLNLRFLNCKVIIMNVYNSAQDDIDDKNNEKPYKEHFPEYCGIQFLPKTLKKLNITGCCDILTSSFLEMSRKLPNLMELVLGDPQSLSGKQPRPNHCVNLEVLISLLKNMPLKLLNINHQFLNWSTEERDQFLEFAEELGLLGDPFVPVQPFTFSQNKFSNIVNEQPSVLDLRLSRCPRPTLLSRMEQTFPGFFT